MSRCFPFPPPGYVRNGARSEALIESIKLQTQREMEKAKKDKKKEKRREKKEKRKERKERKQKEGTASHSSASADGKGQKHIVDEMEKIRADGKLQKGDDCENEQLERSGITEEHDQPVSLCCVSDSTQSSKRKRDTSPSSHDHGTAIRIRLPLRKHRGPEETKLEDQLGSTSGTGGIVDSFTRETNASDHHLQRVTNADAYQSLGNSDSRHCKQDLVNGAATATNILDDESLRMTSLYESLFQNQVLPQLPFEGLKSEDEDQDWLFRSELQEARPVSKKLKSVADASRCLTPSLWPRAQYLPEVEIYALPYAIPF